MYAVSFTGCFALQSFCDNFMPECTNAIRDVQYIVESALGEVNFG